MFNIKMYVFTFTHSYTAYEKLIEIIKLSYPQDYIL